MKAQMALLVGRNGNRNTSQSCRKWFVISPMLERLSFTKMAKMLNCGESCQQFTVKSGVTRLYVSQLAGKKSKRSPMVYIFLLHDPTMWQEKAQHLEQDVGGAPPLPGGVLHSGMPPVPRRYTPTSWLPHPSGDQSKGATLVRNWAENGGKNSPC
jgi:hypothetical protein